MEICPGYVFFIDFQWREPDVSQVSWKYGRSWEQGKDDQRDHPHRAYSSGNHSCPGNFFLFPYPAICRSDRKNPRLYQAAFVQSPYQTANELFCRSEAVSY